MPRHRRPRHPPSAPGHPAQRGRTSERGRPHADEELLYAPAAAAAAAATPLDARDSRRWGGGGLGGLASERFPRDARHPLTQQPYGA
jgi:hypothetical protein